MSSYKDLKTEAWEANMALPAHGVVIFTFGNVSAIDRRRGVFAIKPSGVPYDRLKAEDMVVVDLNAQRVEGNLNPSSDTRTHALLYREFPSIGAVVHTHSTYATAWAQAARPVSIYGTTHADHLPGAVPCTAFMPDDAIRRDYEEETGRQIVTAMSGKNPEETEMILVAGHGPFAWGCNAAKAVYNAVILEELAKMAFLTECINPETEPLKGSLIDKHYQRKHGSNATYGQK